MRVVCDIEANSLSKPTKIWLIICKDIDTNDVSIFRKVTEDEDERRRFLDYASRVNLWIGHNFLGYDYPVLKSLVGYSVDDIHERVIDTLIISKLVNYSRDGHSIEAYGKEFELEKIEFNDWTKYSREMEDYCVRDVEICHRIYSKYNRIISDPDWHSSILLEHRFQLIVNDLHDNGFSFSSERATSLLTKVTKDLEELDNKILGAFPPREVVIREFTPKETKFGTISKTSVPRSLWDRIHEYEVGRTYSHTKQEPFNPSSHKQIVNVLSTAGWCPEDRTTSHIECERELQRLKYTRDNLEDLDIRTKILQDKLDQFKITGWRVNENNLSTLPVSAPAPARLLAKRILLEARRRSLVEWLGLVQEDGRVHGRFYGLGSWTGRMAHQNPNTANIPSEFNLDGSVKLLGKEMRQLWCAPKKKLLVGVDAEGIQLRIFAHYIDDLEFTKALVEGKKDDKTDPHSLNQRVLGSVCKTRAAAKRFVFALLLGAGLWKLSQILGCSQSETKQALDNLLERYTGFKRLKQEVIPTDARRGWFRGLDNRKVAIPGSTISERKHLAMSGYLQNGEAIVIKRAACIIEENLREEKELKQWMFVNIVHDELQSECKNSMDLCLRVAQIKAEAIKQAGEELNLKCPLAGSFWNDEKHDYTIGTNWYATH